MKIHGKNFAKKQTPPCRWPGSMSQAAIQNKHRNLQANGFNRRLRNSIVCITRWFILILSPNKFTKITKPPWTLEPPFHSATSAASTCEMQSHPASCKKDLTGPPKVPECKFELSLICLYTMVSTLNPIVCSVSTKSPVFHRCNREIWLINR